MSGSTAPMVQQRIVMGGSLAGPMAVEGRVLYAPLHRNTDLGIENNSVRAFDTRSGKLLWTFEVEGDPGTPLVTSGVVYATTSAGYVYALDAVSGTQQWRGRMQKPRWSSPAPPLILNGLLFIGGDAHLWALDANTGKRRWKVDARMGVSGTIVADAATALVFFGVRRGNVYALSAATGEVRWQFPAGEESDPHLFQQGNRLYVQEWEQPLRRLHMDTGNQEWQSAVALRSWPVLANDVCYTEIWDDHEDGDSFVALDITRNALLWRTNTKGDNLGQWPCAVGSKLVYATSMRGHLYALDRATGQKKWVIPAEPGTEFCFVQVIGGNLFVGRKHEIWEIADDQRG